MTNIVLHKNLDKESNVLEILALAYKKIWFVRTLLPIAVCTAWSEKQNSKVLCIQFYDNLPSMRVLAYNGYKILSIDETSWQ